MTVSGKRSKKVTDVAKAIGSAHEVEVVAGLRSDRKLRVGMAVALTVLFIALNTAVVVMVLFAGDNDRTMIAAGLIEPDQRLITDKVYMSLVGGTVVQVAAIIVAIARYLFPTRKDNSHE